MSNHEHQGGSDYQPDQPYDQLDNPVRILGRLLATGRILPWEADTLQEAWRELAMTIPDLDYTLLERLHDNLPGPDFPPGLPPRLQELLQEDRGDTLPPVAP